MAQATVIFDNTVTVVVNNGKTLIVNCSPEQFDVGLDLWEQGLNIQDAFPMLSPDEREFIKSGMLPEEWNALFAEEP